MNFGDSQNGNKKGYLNLFFFTLWEKILFEEVLIR